MPNQLSSWRLTAVVLWLFAVSAIVLSAVYLPEAFADGGRGTLGYRAEADRSGNRAAQRIVEFQPDSPLPGAGVALGDRIIATPRGRIAAGERVQLQILSDGRSRIVEVGAARQPVSRTVDVSLLFEGVLALLALGLGTLLVWRRWHDEAGIALGTVLLVGAAGLTPLLPPVGVAGALTIVWGGTGLTLALILMAWSALLMTPTRDGAYRWIARSNVALSLLLLGWILAASRYFFGYFVPAIEIILNTVRPIFQALALVCCVVAFVRAWRLVEPGQRERLRWLFVGLGTVLSSLALLVMAIGLVSSDSGYLTVSLVSDGLTAAAFVTITYAILGQRVIDVGFAINRAIVYAVLTGVMLIGFGVVEWLVDHVLEFEQRKKSALVDGALALAIFLVLHRLQHWISHTVEHVFFRSWHVRAQALDRFLETSEHFTDPGELSKASLEALDAYTGSMGSAIYGRDPQNRFVLMQGTLAGAPGLLSANDQTVVNLKASRGQPLLLETKAERAGENWVFPLTRRGELAGFVRLGPKRNQDGYRPDQIERVARAVRQVGADLHALRLEHAAGLAGVRAAPATAYL